MNKHLETALFENYPEFFLQKELDASQTCMCWGVDCRDGWYSLIDQVCMKIKSTLEERNIPSKTFQFSQIKEKFGSLTLYYDIIDENGHMTESALSLVKSIIAKYQSMSQFTCENCGSTEGARIVGGSYYQCLCYFCDRDMLEEKE